MLAGANADPIRVSPALFRKVLSLDPVSIKSEYFADLNRSCWCTHPLVNG